MFSQESATDPRGSPGPFTEADLASALAPMGSAGMLPRRAYVDQQILSWGRSAGCS